MILLPKFVDLKLAGASRASVGGRFRLTKGKNRGYIDANSGLWIPGPNVVTRQSPWFDNLITNLGLNGLNASTMATLANTCHVGEGTTAASVNDTTLESHLAASGTTAPNGSVSSAQGSPPYYGKWIQTKRFGEGVAAGNISEVGMSPSTPNTNMYTRARVVDGGGSPTSFAVDTDEWLDVQYDHRIYPDHIAGDGSNDDGTGTIAFSGTNYDYVIRPTDVDNFNVLDASDCRGIFRQASIYHCQVGGTGCTLGTVLEGPSGGGLSYHTGTFSFGSYTTDSFTRSSTLELGLAQGNETGGIVVLVFFTGQGNYQMSLDLTSGSGGVPKDGTKICTYTHQITWSRATIGAGGS